MRSRCVLRTGVLLALCGALGMAGSARPGYGEVVRTLVYRQITAVNGSISTGRGAFPVLSRDGSRAVFAVAPGTQDPAQPNRIFVVDADGSNPREVDAYTTFCFCGSQVDINADGSRVLSSDAVQLRIANATGGARPLIALNSNEIDSIKLSGDGTRAFFRVARDTSVRGASPAQPVQRGIYVINADGSGLRQVVGPSQIAALIGVTPDQVFPFSTGSISGIDVPADGSRVVFGQWVKPDNDGVGQAVFGVGLDGAALRQYTERIAFVRQVAISSDGTKVASSISPLNTHSANVEISLQSSDGSGKRVLVASGSRPFPTGLPDSEDPLQLNANGSRLLLGSTGVLLDTGTGAALQLSATGGFYSSDPWRLGNDGLFRATMNDTATRFLYVARDNNAVYQLATLALNPAALGNAPAVSAAAMTPGFVLTDVRSLAVASAAVSTSHPFVRVSIAVFRDSLFDSFVGRSFYSNVLLDDGSQGDAKAGDGTFTLENINAATGAAVGPRSVRIKAEARTADGKLVATAVEFAPFAVVTEAPPPSLSRIAVFRPSTREWFLRSTDGAASTVAFGGPGDQPVPADYLGTGRAQIAVFRPGTREWLIRKDDGGTIDAITFGGPNDVPVAGDYLGLKRAQMAVFRPSTREWFIRKDDGSAVSFAFGGPGDRPVPADYLGLGRIQAAVFRPGTGEWFIRRDDGSALPYTFGVPGDLPIPADYAGTKRAQLAVYRPSSAEFFLRSDNGATTRIPFGGPADRPVPGDYREIGRAQIAVYRPGSAEWFIRSDTGTDRVQFGGPSDEPIPAAFASRSGAVVAGR